MRPVNNTTQSSSLRAAELEQEKLGISMDTRIKRLIIEAGNKEENLNKINLLFVGLSDEEKIKMITTYNFLAVIDAAKRGHSNILNRLIEIVERIQNPNGQAIIAQMLTSENSRLLRQAASNGYNDIVDVLIKTIKKISNKTVQKNILTEMLTAYDSLAIIDASSNGRIDIIDNLLTAIEEILDLDDRRDALKKILINNNLALALSASNGHIDVFKRLIETAKKIPDQDGQNFLTQMLIANGSKAFTLAVKNGHNDIVKLLIQIVKNNRSPNDQNILAQILNNEQNITFAAMEGHIDVVDTLIKAAEELEDDGQNILAHILNNGQAIIFASMKGYDNVINSLINAAKRISDVDIRQNILNQMLTSNNCWAIALSSSKGYNNLIDTFLTAGRGLTNQNGQNVLNTMLASRTIFRVSAIEELISKALGNGVELRNLNINGRNTINQNIAGNGNPKNKNLLSFLTLLSHLPRESSNGLIGRENLVNLINQQLPENNPLRRFLGAFEEILKNPVFPKSQNHNHNQNLNHLPIINSLFNGINDVAMIEQMRGGWHELAEFRKYLNDIENFARSDKKSFEDLSKKQFQTVASTESVGFAKLPADVKYIISQFLIGDINPKIIPNILDSENPNHKTNNFINFMEIVKMAASPEQDLNLGNIDRIIAQRDLRIANRDVSLLRSEGVANDDSRMIEANDRRNESEDRIEIIARESTNNNSGQERQNRGMTIRENFSFVAGSENYRNNRISVDDTPSHAVRGRTVKRIIDGISAEIKDFGSAVKEAFGKCLGR